MPLNFDFETIGKIYTPIAAVAGVAWGWYKRQAKIRERLAKEKRDADAEERRLHQARVDATILKCEMDRKEDRKECREQYLAMQARLDAQQDQHNQTIAEAFSRVADSLDIMVKRKRAQDPDTDVHPAVTPPRRSH